MRSREEANGSINENCHPDVLGPILITDRQIYIESCQVAQ